MRRNAAIVGVAVIGSRIFGLVREVVFASMFGAGNLLDAFLGAFRIPNLLRDLFAEGALSTAFTTVFARTSEKEGEASAGDLANLVLTALVLFLGVVCLLGIIASPTIVFLTNTGFLKEPGKFELTVRLTQILFPFILFVSLAAITMGMLNARHYYGLPASASTAFNVVSVLSGVGLAYLLDPQADWRHPQFSERALYGVAIGVLLGGMAQLAIQLPTLWRLGYRWRWRWDWSDPRLRQVLVIMLPSIIAGSAVQFNVLVNMKFASYIPGAQSWLNCAFRLMQFPIGVFGVAIATVALPALARQQARAELPQMGRTVQEALRLAFFLTIPASVGLAILAEPLIRVIYQHGKFDLEATHQTARALQAYVWGLAGYAGIKIVTPCFYALNEPRTPLRVSIFGMGLNLALNATLVWVLGFGHVGLATTTALIALLNFGQLAFYLRRKIELGSMGDWANYLARVLVASGLCGAAAKGVQWSLVVWQAHGWWREVIALAASVTAGVLVFGLVALVWKFEETEKLSEAIKRRFFK
jgi:putative peptidoglycan lipid II flippase